MKKSEIRGVTALEAGHVIATHAADEIRIGIMGGTFNPIHYGHLVAAEEAWQEFGLERIIFVPTAHPPHKQEPEVSPEHRYQMTKLAIDGNEHFAISDIEINRKGTSYSVDTLHQFKKIYGEQAKLYFIIGADALAELDTWKNVENLPQLCQIIAVNRPGYALNLPPERLSFTHLIEIPGVAISAEEIRQRIKEERTIRYLVPKEVEKYIYEHQLYQQRQERK